MKKRKGKNFVLYVEKIYNYIKEGMKFSDICEKMNMSKQRLQYYVDYLIEGDFIKKSGYSCWEIIKDFSNNELKQVQKTYRIANSKLIEISKLPPDTIRGHAIKIKLFLPKAVYNSNAWKNRQETFLKQDVKFTPIESLYGGGENIILNGTEFNLTNRSILITLNNSYFGQDIDKVRTEMFIDVLRSIKRLERLLCANFGEFNNYKFKICRQHFSLIKNCLAKVYLKSKNEFLKVSDENGLWLLVDNSFSLSELECISPETAQADVEGIRNYFNSHKRTDFKVTPDFILQTFRVQDELNLQIFEALDDIKIKVKELEEMRMKE